MSSYNRDLLSWPRIGKVDLLESRLTLASFCWREKRSEVVIVGCVRQNRRLTFSTSPSHNSRYLNLKLSRMSLPYAADAEISLSPSELDVLRGQYERELASGHATTQTKFNYAWGLVKSKRRDEMSTGVNLLTGESQQDAIEIRCKWKLRDRDRDDADCKLCCCGYQSR